MNNQTTSKTQHTPGPWTSGEQGNGHIVWQPDHGTIATIGGDMVGAQANARLIAAAPSLYEFLQNLSALVRDGNDQEAIAELRGEFCEKLLASISTTK